MPIIRKSKIEPFSAKQMFHLVNDVNSYPEYLPWCKNVRVIREDGLFKDVAVSVSMGPLDKTFTTRNRAAEYDHINMSLVDGPFKKLQGEWRFIPISETESRIEFELDFVFSIGLFSNMLNPIFENMYDSMINAFSERAKQVYG